MMWNFLVGGLMTGATVVLYDGSPVWPDVTAQWALARSGSLVTLQRHVSGVPDRLRQGRRPTT